MSRRRTTKKKKVESTTLPPGLVLIFALAIIIVFTVAVFRPEVFDGFEEVALPTFPPLTEPSAVPSAIIPLPTSTPTADDPGSGADLPFEIYFTRPIYPDRPESRGASPLMDRFIALLSSANTSIDMAVYELDIPEAAAALVEAKQRGVTVRVVTDSDSLDGTDDAMTAAYAQLRKAGIPIVADERSAIMHHKFVVVDQRWVWMGAWNFTEGDTYRLNNNAAVIDSSTLAANYSAEFNRMHSQHLFGPSKKVGSQTPQLVINGAPAENYFSPVNKMTPRLVELLNGAQKSIDFMAFQFTQDEMRDAMAKRAQAGVSVSGVFEKTGSETRFSEFGPLRDLGLPVYQDGNPYIMHHKVLVIDAQTVVFGSYNFSASAEDSNDENTLIVTNSALAARFLEEFNYVRAVAENPTR